MSVAQGGRFGQGFLSSGVSAFFAPGIDGAVNGNDGVGVVLSAALGGTVSAIGGGSLRMGR